ncbi:hypothetical protein KJ766_02720, partial [Patescibacteria group bacterium]|nr:hypothetical protein [Patescibacteria group bacterium]
NRWKQAIETVIDGKTGTLFYEQSWEELADTILNFDHTKFDPEKIRKHAEQFSVDVFREKLSKYVQKTWDSHKKNQLIIR